MHCALKKLTRKHAEKKYKSTKGKVILDLSIISTSSYLPSSFNTLVMLLKYVGTTTMPKNAAWITTKRVNIHAQAPHFS